MQLQLALHLPRDAASVPVVRRICTLTLESLQVSSEDVSDVALALTEACANAIEHAANGHDYDVALELDGNTCTIRVIDHGGASLPGGGVTQPEPEAWSGTPELATIEALTSSGRGIALMENLMDRLSFRPVNGGTSLELVKRLTAAADSPLTSPATP